MTHRERLLAALIEERFPSQAIEAERVNLAEPAEVRMARVLVPPVLAGGLDAEALQEFRRDLLREWPEPSRAETAGVPPRQPRSRPSALVGRPRSGMDDHTLAAVRVADRMRKRAERTPA